MKIILDTNAIFDDDLMEKTSMSILDNFAKQTQAEICIPFVVVEEKIRQFGERCVSVVSAYRQANNLKALLGHKTIQIENANLLASEYRKLLVNRLAELKIKILPLPNTSIANLLNRDLERRSPFDSSGKGFRDALIWETILQEMQENAEDIVIISDDQVFSRSNKEEPASRLHSDLQADLEKLGIRTEKISVSRNISSFIEGYVKPVLTKFWKQGWTTEGTFMEGFEPERILRELKETLVGILHTSLLNLLEINSTNTYVYKIDILRWPENAEIVEAFKLEEKKLLLVTKAFVVFDAEVITTEDQFLLFRCWGKRFSHLVEPGGMREQKITALISGLVATCNFRFLGITKLQEWKPLISRNSSLFNQKLPKYLVITYPNG